MEHDDKIPILSVGPQAKDAISLKDDPGDAIGQYAKHTKHRDQSNTTVALVSQASKVTLIATGTIAVRSPLPLRSPRWLPTIAPHALLLLFNIIQFYERLVTYIKKYSRSPG